MGMLRGDRLLGRVLSGPLLERLETPERWILVGDEVTADRLRAYEPLEAFATVVGTVPPGDGASTSGRRAAALDIVDHHHADRVVISSQHADDEGLLELMRTFKSIGIPVSLLPRPLDLLDSPPSPTAGSAACR